MTLYNPHLHTEQEVLNSSFDETTGVLGSLGLEYDPSGSTKRSVTGNLAMKIVVSGSITYVGKATIGSSGASAVWQVQKIDETSGTIITWADGNDNFDNVWNNYASLTYS